MENKLSASIILLREQTCNTIDDDLAITSELTKDTTKNIENLKENNFTNNTTQKKYIRDFLIRKCFVENDFIEVRCAVVGNVDSGKSTLLGKKYAFINIVNI